MSLGFLTESALLPSKAKAIQVDSKSILDLKAVVFQKEQERRERQRRRHEAGDALTSTHQKNEAKRGKRARKITRRDGCDEDVRPVHANRGVEKRRRRDEADRELDVDAPDDDAALQQKSREMLARKARLYEALAAGRPVEDSGNSRAVAAESLVDFHAKRSMAAATCGASRSPDSEPSELVTIVDEFGRSRRVSRTSDEYAAWQQQQHEHQQHVVESVAATSANDPAMPTSAERAGSYVVSQWDTTLKHAEKEFLQQVHANVQQVKKAALVLDKKARKQQRLAMLRQQAIAASTTTQTSAESKPPTNARQDREQDQAASAQAAAFLDQLSTLM